MSGTRFTTCEACGGEGRDLRGIDDRDYGECRACEGARVVEIETDPVEKYIDAAQPVNPFRTTQS